MRLITKAEVAKKLRRHPSTVMRLVKQGVLRPPIKLGPDPSPCLFNEDEIDEDVAALLAARPRAKVAAE